MKVYYSPLCEDCRNFLKDYYSFICETDRELVSVFRNRNNLIFELINITESTANLGEFIRLRDTSPAFEEIRRNGGIGIPAFVNGGRVTFDSEEAFGWAESTCAE